MKTDDVPCTKIDVRSWSRSAETRYSTDVIRAQTKKHAKATMLCAIIIAMAALPIVSSAQRD